MRIVLFTPPTTLPSEHAALHSLAARATSTPALLLPSALHVRKPGADEASVEGYLKKLPPALLERAVLHSHHALARKFDIQVRDWIFERKRERGKREGRRDAALNGLRWGKKKLTLDPFSPSTTNKTKGVHFTEAARNALPGGTGRTQRPEREEGRCRRLTLSTSLHSCAEVEAEAAAAAAVAARRNNDDSTSSSSSSSYDYVFLSPVFESISKPGYGGKTSEASSAQFWLEGGGGDENRSSSPPSPSPALSAALTSARKSRLGVVALGGVDVPRLGLARGLGFEAVAVLGAVWGSEDPAEAWGEVVRAAAAAAPASASAPVA